MTRLRHRTFVGPTVYTQGASLNDNREAVRARAQAFAGEVGVGNVVSVCEHAMTLGPFSVVVWYRGEGDYGPEAVTLTNADIKAFLQIGPSLRPRADAVATPATPAAAEGGTARASAPSWVWLLILAAALVPLLAFLNW
jgi:hypothetical protein